MEPTPAVRELIDEHGQRWRLVAIERSRVQGEGLSRLDMADGDPMFPRWIPTLSVDLGPDGTVRESRRLADVLAPVDDLIRWIENGA